MGKLLENSGELLYTAVNFVDRVISAFGKFFKSSYLSLLFLVIILIMVQALEQANTLLVDMVETHHASLIACFIMVAVFAAVLSHYPRYIFYAENINDSRDDHQWYAYKWLGYPIFTFAKLDVVYKQDYKAKFFRHCLGLVIFVIWHYYIYQTFYPKMVFGGYNMGLIKTFTIICYVLPGGLLIILLDKFDRFQDKIMGPKITDDPKKDAENIEKLNNTDRLKIAEAAKAEEKGFIKLGVTALVLLMIITVVYAVFMLIFLKFNIIGYWMLQIFTLLLAVVYALFRVFRIQIVNVYPKLWALSNSVGYLRFYFVVAIIVIGFLIYSNLAVYFNWTLANAMLILLSYFFIFYYGLACLVKYYFMLSIFSSQKKDLEAIHLNNLNQHSKNPVEMGTLSKAEQEELKHKIAFDTNKSYLESSGVKVKNRHHLELLDEQTTFSKNRRLVASVLTVILIILIFISHFSESVIHELEIYEKSDVENQLDIEQFKGALRERTEKPLFFVAAHGGGLKANIWTMKVLNQIQIKTEGDFINQTISFSGASGGMMGLSLYSVLGGKYNSDFDAIGQKIDEVAKENFASRDLALTFGFDAIRKLYPFSRIGAYRDRSYYSLVTYKNIIEEKSSMTLDSLSFTEYWKENIFDKSDGYFPSLIINTAKTNGKRGVFYSVVYPKDSTLFYNSDNLSQLYNGSIAYYEAVSSTNRFPALSPAAKIKSYGHYIDAGAIDNSGLLSSIDLHNYLSKDSTLRATKKVFVEIINGRNNYIWHLIEMFKKQKEIPHFIIDEVEQDNMVADIKTGLNLDKIPNYLSDYLTDWSKDPSISYIPIYLPFQIELKEVEDFLGGKLTDEMQILELKYFLEKENAKVKRQIDDDGKVWESYEPTLARHLSKSTIAYYDRVIKSELINEPINAIKLELKGKSKNDDLD